MQIKDIEATLKELAQNKANEETTVYARELTEMLRAAATDGAIECLAYNGQSFRVPGTLEKIKVRLGDLYCDHHGTPNNELVKGIVMAFGKVRFDHHYNKLKQELLTRAKLL